MGKSLSSGPRYSSKRPVKGQPSTQQARQQARQQSSPSSPTNQQEQPPLLSDLLVKAQDAMLILDFQGVVVELNPAAAHLWGCSSQDLLGRSLASLLLLPLELGGETWDNPPPGLFSATLRLHSQPDPPSRPVEGSLTPAVAPQRHLLMLRDMTHRDVPVAAELRRQRQRLELFAEVTLKIRQSLQLQEILRTTVSEVQRILQADRVLIYQIFPDGTGKAISEAVLPSYPEILGLEFPAEVFPEEYGQLYAQGRVRAIANVADPAEGVSACLVEFTAQFGIKAKLIVPILHNPKPSSPVTSPSQQPASQPTKLWGLLIAHQCQGPREWVDFELELMQQLADQISIAIAQGEFLENLEELVEQRTAELQTVNQNLRQSEEQLKLITNALPVLIAYVDRQQCYQFNNQAYEDWLGESPDAIHGAHLSEVWGEEAYHQMQGYIEQALAGSIVKYEYDMVTRKGKQISASVAYIPHIDPQVGVKGFFSLLTDISDRKAIERMKDEFISVVSHELRTPLTSLHSALKILATGRLGTLSDSGQQMLEIADENTERLVRLVNNVLDLQRIESGEVMMEKSACNAAQLMVQAIEAMEPMAQQHGIILTNKPCDLWLWADADYILQALTNLLSNAIKFSPPQGVVELTVRPWHEEAQSRGERAVLFQVRDQGQGIPLNKLESIFERFKQVDSSDARKKGGTGLGLTICRKIVEQHGGKIWAESQVGQGSVFSFTLPELELPSEPVPSEASSNRLVRELD